MLSAHLDDVIRSLSSVLQIGNADVGRQSVTTKRVGCEASFYILDSERESPGIHASREPHIYCSGRLYVRKR